MPLLIGNFVYIDDINRMHLGYGWDFDGRFAATWIMQFISGGGFITDIFPFGLIISSLVYVFAANIVSDLLKLGNNIKIFTCLIFLISPFTIESLSYRFDAIPMSLSVLSAVLPFIYINNRIRFMILSIVSLNISLLTYQSSFFIYPIVFILYAVDELLNNDAEIKDIVRSSALSVSYFFAAYLIYKLELHFFAAELHGRDTTIFSGDIMGLLIKNIDKTYSLLIKPLLTIQFILYSLPLVVISLFCYSKAIVNSIGTSRIYIAVLLPFILLISIAIASIPNLILMTPWFSIRTGLAFGAILFFIPLLTKKLSTKILYPSYSLLFVYSFSMMSSFVDAMTYQDRMRSNILSTFGYEIAKTDGAKIVINGTMPNSTVYKSVTNKYPFLKRAIPNYMDNSWNWGVGYFRLNGLVGDRAYPGKDERDTSINKLCAYPIVTKNIYGTMRVNKNSGIFIIDFKKTNC